MTNDIQIPGVCLEAVKALKDAERGRLILAAIVYRSEGRELSLCGGERYLWPEFKAAIDQQKAEECEERLAKVRAGQASGRVRKGRNEQNEQVFNERNTPLSPPLPLSPTPPISNPPIIPPKENTLAQRTADFEIFWKAYPKKKGGKQNALKSFLKVKVPFAELMAALEAQKRSEDWQKENGQFIPYPTTWLNQGRWEDEVTPCSAQQNEERPRAPRFLRTEIIDGEEVAIFERT